MSLTSGVLAHFDRGNLLTLASNGIAITLLTPPSAVLSTPL